MKILFAGGAEISVPSLNLVAREHTVVSVLTHPDAAAGRGRRRTANPVKAEAEQLGLPVIEASILDETVMDLVRSLGPELLVVVAFGRIFSRKFLALFPRGGVNLHPSLLPRYRGPSPVTAAILNGDDETGITIQRVEYKMDAGDILLQHPIPLTGTETTGSLLAAVAEPGANLLCRALREWEAGRLQPVPQIDDDISYCSLIKKEDGRIAWTDEAEMIERKIRAFAPWPGAFTEYNGSKLMIRKAGISAQPDRKHEAPGKVIGIDKKEGILVQTGNGLLFVNRLQLQAKKTLDWKSFLNGNRQFVGSHLI